MAESGNSPKNSTNGMPNWLRGPVLWVVLTGILAGAAAVLHMSGPAYSVHALTVTTLAQQAAIASLAAEDELNERVNRIVAERTRVFDELTRQGWKIVPSQAKSWKLGTQFSRAQTSSMAS